ncbi:hypothetical protein MW887_006474 [Aspergillus wentii]|nr:hypothetical protein MW887_006474 [Aspergillus wentii]
MKSLRWSAVLLSVLALADFSICSTESDEVEVSSSSLESEIPLTTEETDFSSVWSDEIPTASVEGDLPSTSEEPDAAESGDSKVAEEAELPEFGSEPETPSLPTLQPFDAAAHSAYGKTPTGERILDIIPVVRDGLTCPSGMEPATSNSWDGIHQCEYGVYSAQIPKQYQSSDWQCCYSEQGSFVLSVPGESSESYPTWDTRYILDEAPCCRGSSEQDALFDASSKQCQYGKAVLNLPGSDYLTKCCWDEKLNNWSIHMKQHWPFKTMPVNKEWAQDVGFGHATLIVKHANIYGHHIDLAVQGVFGDLFDETRTVRLAFSHKWTRVTRFEVRVPILYSTLYIDVESVVNEDNTVSLRIHWTGTKLLVGLNESTFVLRFDSSDFKGLMETYPAC